MIEYAAVLFDDDGLIYVHISETDDRAGVEAVSAGWAERYPDEISTLMRRGDDGWRFV